MKMNISRIVLRIVHHNISYRFEYYEDLWHGSYLNEKGLYKYHSFYDFKLLLTETELANFNKIINDLRQVTEFIKEKSE